MCSNGQARIDDLGILRVEVQLFLRKEYFFAVKNLKCKVLASKTNKEGVRRGGGDERSKCIVIFAENTSEWKGLVALQSFYKETREGDK